MEEQKHIYKYRQLPQYMKQKRRRFNGRRYISLPTQQSVSQVTDKSLLLSPLSHRFTDRHNNLDSLKSQKLRNSVSNFNSVVYGKSNLECTERFSQCSQKIRKKSKQKVPNFWETQLHMPNVKTCKMECSGYSKRMLRLRQHNYIYNKLFTDSSTVSTYKINLSKNVKIMSRILMGNLSINKFNDQESDDKLMLNKSQLRLMQEKQNRRSEGY